MIPQICGFVNTSAARRRCFLYEIPTEFLTAGSRFLLQNAKKYATILTTEMGGGPMAAEGKKYNPGFDLIRIASMLAVILIHLTTYLPIPDRWKFLFTWGSAGVPLFFVLSGFLTARTFVPRGGVQYCSLL